MLLLEKITLIKEMKLHLLHMLMVLSDSLQNSNLNIKPQVYY